MSETVDFATHETNTQAAMAAAGVRTEDPIIADYWGFDETKRWMFPDGKQYIEWKPMNEGARARYQKATNHSITIKRDSGDAAMNVDPAKDRHELLKTSVCGWSLYQGGESVPFSPYKLEQFLKVVNPALIEKLEREIREGNEWMRAEDDPEAIRTEIERLSERLEEAERRQAGEADSSGK